MQFVVAELLGIEVNAALAFVSKAVVNDFFNQAKHLGDVLRDASHHSGQSGRNKTARELSIAGPSSRCALRCLGFVANNNNRGRHLSPRQLLISSAATVKLVARMQLWERQQTEAETETAYSTLSACMSLKNSFSQ